MNIRKKYIKPKTTIIYISQDCPLMSGSSSEEPGIDKEKHNEVIDPGEQLSKPNSPFFTDSFGSALWED